MSVEDKIRGFKKDLWWKENLKWILSLDGLCVGRGRSRKLQYAYREMLGGSGHEMYRLMARHLPKPTYFEGVDYSRAVMLWHALEDRPFYLECGDIFVSTLERSRMLRDNVALGFFNADTQEVPRKEWWDDHEDDLLDIAENGVRMCDGRFAQITNFPIGIGGGPGVTLKGHLEAYARGLTTTYRGWKMPDLMTGVQDPKGQTMPFKTGVFHLYKSQDPLTLEDNVVCMATVRMAFNGRAKTITFDR